MRKEQQPNLPQLEDILHGMPEPQACNCGEGLPEISFDFTTREWFVWCGCGVNTMSTMLDVAILGFNAKVQS